MPSYTDALRGYAHRVHRRDGFTCVYCGWDGSQWPNWLYLSWDHLLPRDHPDRDDERFIVTACRICNEFHNRTSFDVEGKTPEQIVAMKKTAIAERRDEYRDFWEENVAPKRSVEQAIRLHVHPGQVLHTPSRKAPFVVERIDSDGVVLLLGKGQWWTRIRWECLEGVIPYIRQHGGIVDIGGQHAVKGRPGTLDGYLKGCLKRTTAGWVAVLLETAGIVGILRTRPARVRIP